jgi:hypothetical protein
MRWPFAVILILVSIALFDGFAILMAIQNPDPVAADYATEPR